MDPGSPSTTKTAQWAVLTAGLLFFLLGIALLPYPGLQNDECLFAQPLYATVGANFSVPLGGHERPLMLMTYLGTAKTLVYRPLLRRWRPSAWSIRLPGLITATITIWMFGLLLYRLGGSFAAMSGSFLLALDPSYVLTSVFDWGPVVLQHFLLVAGVLAFHGFQTRGSKAMLAMGAFLFGFAMWDKALFSWMLTGLGVASLLFLAPEIRQRVTWSNVALGFAAFVLGASPLIIYNVRNDVETFRGNAKLTTAEIWAKTRTMPRTLDGSGLFGYLIREESDDSPRVPQTAVERASTAVRNAVGQRRQGWLPAALLLTLSCLPLWWKKWKMMAFAFVTALVAWLLMASTRGAGGAVHHIVLMWPVPQFLVAIGLATAVGSRVRWWKWAVTVVVGMVCFQNVLVVNQYLYNAYRVGPGSSWTDAIFPLNDRLVRMKPERVNLMDWGTELNLIALTRGTMNLRWGTEAGDHETPTANDWSMLDDILKTADKSVFVRHVEPIEVTPGSEKRFAERALTRGYQRQSVEIIPDRYGRKMFEIYRFVKVNP